MSTGATLALFARLLVSLAIVIGLMWYAARVVRRRGFGMGGNLRRPDVQIEVIARRSLGKNASITIVRAADQALILGVTDNQITKLADADLTQIDLADADGQWTAAPNGPDGPTPSWKAMLDQFADRTARR